jgi:hypothetical protein
MKSSFRKNAVRIQGGNPYRTKPQEMDSVNDFAREGQRLGLLFNGMQQRINEQPPVALFTDNKTKTTFGVEPGQDIKFNLIQIRKKFR